MNETPSSYFLLRVSHQYPNKEDEEGFLLSTRVFNSLISSFTFHLEKNSSVRSVTF